MSLTLSLINFINKWQRITIFNFAGYIVSVPSIQLCCCSTRVTTDSKLMGGCAWGIKLWAIEAIGHSLPDPSLQKNLLDNGDRQVVNKAFNRKKSPILPHIINHTFSPHRWSAMPLGWLVKEFVTSSCYKFQSSSNPWRESRDHTCATTWHTAESLF